MVLDLTIAIPVRNEEQNLPGCLAAIGKDLAQRIVVIDSNSADRTPEIAMSFGVELVNFTWDGKFPKKRNWFLRNYTPETKWVLFLDADEYLTESFKEELRNVLNDKNEDKVGYWLNYTVYFLGKKLKGGYPLRKLALFRVGAGEYEQIEEEHWSRLDMEVHEHPVLSGKEGFLRSKIDHQDFRGISHFVHKHMEYANWEAERFLNSTNKTEKLLKLTWKQRLKYNLMRTPLIGLVFFFGSFFLYGGFRDGVRGFTHAVLRMSYFMQVYCKIQEIKNSSAKYKEFKWQNNKRTLNSYKTINGASKQLIK